MDKKQQLIDIMQNHRGRERATDSKTLADKMGMGNFELRDLYASIVTEGSAFLGSNPEAGFFMIEDEEDFDLAVRQIKGRISKMASRLAALNRMHEEGKMLSFDEARVRLKEVFATAYGQ